MIAVAVSLNLGIALFCLYVTWHLWRLTQVLGAVADALVVWEQQTHQTLNPAVIPPAILQGQSGAAGLRGRYGQLQSQLQRLQRVIAVIGLVPLASRWLGRARRQRRFSPRMKASQAKKR